MLNRVHFENRGYVGPQSGKASVRGASGPARQRFPNWTRFRHDHVPPQHLIPSNIAAAKKARAYRVLFAAQPQTDQLIQLMKLTCYVHDGWTMYIRPAPVARAWMDATPERYAYRCLPLSIANAHGWEIFTPAGFWCMWTGGSSSADVQIRTDLDMPPGFAPASIFGSGVFTLHT
jgi:hypothetical protein